MKIAILYICTGNYTRFFEGFYTSCEKNLMPEADKFYFVWTDDDNLGEGKARVNIIHKECAGFPADSLFRFEYFLQVEKELEKYDYIYFFNANAEIVKPVGEELLPDNTGLLGTEWPLPNRKSFSSLPIFYSFERNKKSKAYIKPFDGPYIQYMGGLNGGKAKDYLQMIKILNANIKDDYERGIIACAHDQSHINHYLHNHPCKVLPYGFACPEEYAEKYESAIIFRDKVRLSESFRKGEKHSIKERFGRLRKLIVHALKWII